MCGVATMSGHLHLPPFEIRGDAVIDIMPTHRWSSSAAFSSTIRSLCRRESSCVKYAHGGQGSLRCPRGRADHESANSNIPADEIKRLQRCINDLISLLALPAMWSGSKPGDIVPTLLDSLLRMPRSGLRVCKLDSDLIDAAPSKTVRCSIERTDVRPRELCASLNGWLGDDLQNVISGTQSHWDERGFTVSCPLGVHRDSGSS